MRDQVKELRSAVDVVANILTGIYARLDALETSAPAPEHTDGYLLDVNGHGWRYADAISIVPEGYDTVLGYLAKNHPDVLDTLDYRDPEVTQRDGFKLAHWCRNECKPIVYVQAPPALQWCGIETVRAYPVELLERRWG